MPLMGDAQASPNFKGLIMINRPKCGLCYKNNAIAYIYYNGGGMLLCKKCKTDFEEYAKLIGLKKGKLK